MAASTSIQSTSTLKTIRLTLVLSVIATEESMAENLRQSLDGLNKETAKTQLLVDTFLLDLTKNKMTISKEILK